MDNLGLPTFQDFISNSPMYSKFALDPLAMEVFKFLSTPESIYAMIQASEKGVAALFGVVSQLDSQFGGKRTNDFSLNDDFSKQAIGNMTRVILEPFGYLPTARKKISSSKSNHITSAAVYEQKMPASLKAMQIVTIVRVEPTNVNESEWEI